MSDAPKIPIARPLFGAEEIAAAAKPLESGWIVQGPFVAEFESRFAAFTGTRHAVACSNGTTALHLANAALRLGEGDEVIVPAFTWIATPNSVVYCGATPVFVDIDLASYNIDTAAVEARITSRTKGILPVHLFGLCAEMDPILDLARRHSLWTVEDAACAFGASYRGRSAGTIGDAATFSFHPRKSITTGEGGMVTTANDEIARLVRSMRDHGVGARADEPPFLLADYDEVGFNYRLTDLQAAVGCAQMDRAAFILGERRRRARIYDERLAELEWLRTPHVPAHMEHGYQAYVVLFAPEEPSMANINALERRRNALMATLDDRGIITRQGTHAPVLRAVYRQRFGIDPADYPNAVMAEKLTLALPLYPQMTDEEQERVIGALREIGPC
ncbi:MAG TPA: DegT/DnrJ/EryC1/StrS family aminotransferase [Thermoanaerobaculia bacterium]|nr:DegT/DnrJ/EryC1/StrS family aminotransferase [Thermoanaerobaculia bacterium]